MSDKPPEQVRRPGTNPQPLRLFQLLLAIAITFAVIMVIEPSALTDLRHGRVAEVARDVAGVNFGADSANSVRGFARVVDGDTLVIGQVRVRLHGIDAPESKQTCKLATTEYPCGQAATAALQDKIGREAVTCSVRDTDRYGRKVSVCEADGLDLNAWMVRQGWAVAYTKYSRDYARQQSEAQAARLGLWAGTFVMPWDYRAAK